MHPGLILNPRQDEAFATLAERLMADETMTPESLQASLRERYPLAIVRPRQLSSEPGDVWYVYRDGRWVDSPAEES